MNYRKLRMTIINNSLSGLYDNNQESKATRICQKLTRRINKISFGTMQNNSVKCMADYQYLCE